MEVEWEAQQVVLRVARCADRSDISGMVSYFSETAVLEVGERSVQGRDGLFEFFGGGSASPGPMERTKHVITNTIVSSEGEELVVTSYFQVLRRSGIANWGRYEDRLGNAGGTWQIVHRKVFVDGQSPRPAPRADSAPAPR